MAQADERKQKLIADLIRRWITSEAVRDYLRKALNLPVEQGLPGEHKSLLMKLIEPTKSDRMIGFLRSSSGRK
ncbi:hypothetical protein X759_20955 [Mesorhizobium sp. LSHC420B00]|nr:hypothetical protein X759_20955 [Mesorhizobium sp. LSHC420B00]